MLATKDECERAKAVLDPNAPGGMTQDNLTNAPIGCSRFQKKWHFNIADKGQADGESEPVCKLAQG